MFPWYPCQAPQQAVHTAGADKSMLSAWTITRVVLSTLCTAGQFGWPSRARQPSGVGMRAAAAWGEGSSAWSLRGTGSSSCWAAQWLRDLGQPRLLHLWMGSPSGVSRVTWAAVGHHEWSASLSSS